MENIIANFHWYQMTKKMSYIVCCETTVRT